MKHRLEEGILPLHTQALATPQSIVSALVLFFPFLFLELMTEPRALPLLGKCSATGLNPQPLSLSSLGKKTSVNTLRIWIHRKYPAIPRIEL